jgi:hypothetical protein
MPTLKQALQEQDIGYLRIVADLWRVEVELPDVRKGRANLTGRLLDKALVTEVCTALPSPATRALAALQARGGRQRWSDFTREHGPMRDMGPAKRDREQPYLKPVSTVETLYYRALIGRAFFQQAGELVEYAFLPEDLASLFPPLASTANLPLGRPATPSERKKTTPVSDQILDDACSLLAALRLSEPLETLAAIAENEDWLLPPEPLTALLAAAGLLDKKGLPNPDAVRDFLEAPREKALAQLVRTWRQSPHLDELRLLPGLQAEGTWQADPRRTREAMLAMLNLLDLSIWQSLNAFIEEVQQIQPDFQRAGGEYDAWYLRETSSGTFLRGRAHWMSVEGALLRFMLSRLLPALGILDTAAPDKGTPAAAFKLSQWGQDLLDGQDPPALRPEKEKLTVSASLQIDVPRRAPRVVRYQVARFCTWDRLRRGGYRYQITPAALEQAASQGLKVEHLIALLKRHHNGPLPPVVPRTLERWSQQGTQARIESVTVLRVTHPEILEQLKASRAARFLDLSLGPTAITIKPGASERVYAALAELGVLAHITLQEESED